MFEIKLLVLLRDFEHPQFMSKLFCLLVCVKLRVGLLSLFSHSVAVVLYDAITQNPPLYKTDNHNEEDSE